MPINITGILGPSAGDLREDTTTGDTSGLSQTSTPAGTIAAAEEVLNQGDPCPPGGIPGDPDSGLGGEEPFGEANFGDLDFLAPIEEIETADFQTGGSIREINIFNQNSFLRSTENLFVTDQAGNTTLGPSALSSNLHSSLVYKTPRISPFHITRANRNSAPSVEQVGFDKLRVANNRFWCLEGSERSPIQEAWIDDRNSDTFADKEYMISFFPQDSSGNSVIEQVNLFFVNTTDTSGISGMQDFTVDFGNQQFDKVVPANSSFIDTNTSIPQPLLTSESLQLSDDTIAANSYTIDFEAVVRERAVQPEYLDKPEARMKSLYRDYYRMLNPEFTDECDIEDPVQKFLSSNFNDMKDANASTELLDRFANYIKLTITRPSSLFSGPEPPASVKVPNNFAVTGFDKYILEALTGYGNGRNETNYIQIADESSPTSQQSIRTNDQFFVGFLGTLKPETLSYAESHEDFSSARAERAVSRSTDYPLKFENFDDVDQLEASDLQPSINFADFLANQASTNMRKCESIYSGIKAPSAIVGYKIEKRRSSNGSLLQTFYIMEPPGEKDVVPIEFLDTQVKYGESYKYRIYSLSLVFGTEYSFGDIPTISIGDTSVRCTVTSSPHVKLVEAPFFQKTVSMMDLPPLPPEVSFLPDQRNPNNLSIILNHNVGDRKQVPVMLASSDDSIITQMKTAQTPNDRGEIQYYSDTISEKYEIFTLRIPPESYFDFDSGTKKQVLVNESKSVIHNMPIEHLNKDYYFTFRSVEPTGISNPTPVYKFRMINTSNGTFMVLEEYDMLTKLARPVNFNFDHALKISPSILQKTIQYQEGTNLSSRDFALSAPSFEEISLGTTSESIWGKKYKFRITSKSTGRKIDINTTFNQNSLENNPVLQFRPDECDPLPEQEEEREDPIIQPDPDCISELPKLPVLLGKVSVTSTKSCSDGTKKIRTRDRNYVLDLNSIIEIDGRPIGLLEYAKMVSPELANNCQCPENSDAMIDFIPPLAYEQQKRAEADQDYIAIFDTDGHIPKNIADATVVDDFVDQARNATEELKLEQESVRKQQELWWTDTGDPADSLQVLGVIDSFANDASQEDFVAMNDAIGTLYNQYFWPTHDSAGEEINVEKRACLDQLKTVVKDLMTRKYTVTEANALLGNPASEPMTPMGLFKPPVMTFGSTNDSALLAARKSAQSATQDALKSCPEEEEEEVIIVDDNDDPPPVPPAFVCVGEVEISHPETQEKLKFSEFEKTDEGCVAKSEFTVTIKLRCNGLKFGAFTTLAGPEPFQGTPVDITREFTFVAFDSSVNTMTGLDQTAMNTMAQENFTNALKDAKLTLENQIETALRGRNGTAMAGEGEDFIENTVEEIDDFFTSSCALPEPEEEEEEEGEIIPGNNTQVEDEWNVTLGILCRFKSKSNSSKAWDIVWSPQTHSLTRSRAISLGYKTSDGSRSDGSLWFSKYLNSLTTQQHLANSETFSIDDAFTISTQGSSSPLPAMSAISGFQAVMDFVSRVDGTLSPRDMEFSRFWKDNWTVDALASQGNPSWWSEFGIKGKIYSLLSGDKIKLPPDFTNVLGAGQVTVNQGSGGSMTVDIGTNNVQVTSKVINRRFRDSFWFGNDNVRQRVISPHPGVDGNFFPSESGSTDGHFHIVVKLTKTTNKRAIHVLMPNYVSDKTFINNNGTGTWTYPNRILVPLPNDQAIMPRYNELFGEVIYSNGNLLSGRTFTVTRDLRLDESTSFNNSSLGTSSVPSIFSSWESQDDSGLDLFTGTTQLNIPVF